MEGPLPPDGGRESGAVGDGGGTIFVRRHNKVKLAVAAVKRFVEGGFAGSEFKGGRVVQPP
jgi:hypothetical protein